MAVLSSPFVFAIRGRRVEADTGPRGHDHRPPLPVELDEVNLREDPQQAPGELGGPRLPTQDLLEIPARRAAPVAKRSVARGKWVTKTVFPLMYVYGKA